VSDVRADVFAELQAFLQVEVPGFRAEFGDRHDFAAAIFADNVAVCLDPGHYVLRTDQNHDAGLRLKRRQRRRDRFR